jgi:vacuolar-type H+-ATPase subunit I/STV1
MSLSSLSWLLLAVQIALFAITASVAPIVLRPRLVGYCVYSVTAAGAWLAYAVAAMRFDWTVNNDVPGVGYLLVGFAAWLIGSLIFGIRAQRTKRENAANAQH